MKANCDCCVHFSYDEEYNDYECQVNMDEDEMGRLLSNPYESCPYFRFYDEYTTVRKQN